MVMFEPYGPHVIPVASLPSARRLKEDLAEFWQKIEEEVAEAVGCYVFGVKSGRDLLPFYVGMTREQTLRKECFNPRNINIYNGVIGGRERGTPVMSFLVHPVRRGPNSRRAIEELEKFLIEKGLDRNDRMHNQRCGEPKCQIKWGIRGVYRRGPGVPSRAARELAEMMGILPSFPEQVI